MNRSLNFTVTDIDEAFATEVLYCNTDNDARSMPDIVGRLSILVEALPADAVVTIDVLKPGKAPGDSTAWLLAAVTLTAVGLADLIELANWVGVRIRAQSGATEGTATVHATWHKMAQQ